MAVPNSILWVVEGGELELTGTRSFLEQLGIDKDRFFTSPYEPSKEEFVRRGLVVTVLVDPIACCGQSTSLDGLWSGTPIITMQGTYLNTRVTSSLLHELQLPALITNSIDEFVSRIIWFATHPAA